MGTGEHYAQTAEGKLDTKEWVKSGDPRGLRELKPETGFGISHCQFGRRSCDGLMKVGKTNHKTGAITVYSYEHRVARTEEEQAHSFYGMLFFWSPLSVNGEDVLAVERAAGIGSGRREPTNGKEA